MKEILSLFVLGMLFILGISSIVGAVMFIVDVWKWSKRPEKFTTMEEDLSKHTNNVVHQNNINEISFNENGEVVNNE